MTHLNVSLFRKYSRWRGCFGRTSIRSFLSTIPGLTWSRLHRPYVIYTVLLVGRLVSWIPLKDWNSRLAINTIARLNANSTYSTDTPASPGNGNNVLQKPRAAALDWSGVFVPALPNSIRTRSQSSDRVHSRTRKTTQPSKALIFLHEWD